MKSLRRLSEIEIPLPQEDRQYDIEVFEEIHVFVGLKALLGAADHSKAGDRSAGLAADNGVEREAARQLLSELTLQHLYDHPLLDDNGRVDDVMRVNYDIDLEVFDKIRHFTVGEIKHLLLQSQGSEILKIGRALTGVMASAVAKLCDTHELILIPSKISAPSKARTNLGLPSRLSSRLQPNHPTDDLRGITLLTYAGLSLSGGDALIGVNPANDDVDTISGIYELLDKLRSETGAPTQICVLSHVKTQMQCLRNGAPVEIMFQSLAGTDSTNLGEFDITIELLDEAYHLMQELSPLKKQFPDAQVMYFETGQGSEYTYGKHNGMDMATCEALCYGLARRYEPFMVNNVTGFIGPETHFDNFEMLVSNLQDHFTGKLLGLPMGMAPCFTLHSQISLEGQQMATQMLTAAGANYYMDVHLNTDRMLAYFDTSAHDNQTLREIYSKKPTPEYEQWAVSKGILKYEANEQLARGPNWGNPAIFTSREDLKELRKATPVIYDFENSGPRPNNSISRQLQVNQAFAREAIYKELDLETLKGFRVVKTKAANKEAHLNSPDLGSYLSDDQLLEAEYQDIQIVVSDGLSANAVHANIEDLLEVMQDGFESKGYNCGQPIGCRYGRVKLAEDIAERLKPRVVVYLIGERPGGTASAAQSLSCYFIYNLMKECELMAAAEFSGNPDIRYEYSVLSNIYGMGLPPIEAGSVIVNTVEEILNAGAAGNRLEAIHTLRVSTP